MNNLLNLANNKFLRSFLLPIGDFAFGQKMISRLNYLEDAQWWSRPKIIDQQNQSFSKLLKVAYEEIPFYRQIMQANGIRSCGNLSIEDLKEIPIVTKEMLRFNFPQNTTRYTGQKTYLASTSGSTGKNFYVAEDPFTAGWYRASFMLALEWSGWGIGEKHLQTGMTIQRSIDRKIKDFVLQCSYVSAYQLDDQHLEEILSIVERKKIQYIWGYPGSLYYLAKHAKKVGWNLPIKSAVTWGDMLVPHYRKEIESNFSTKVFDTYGCGEGIQISAQCDKGNYHIHALDTIVEFVDDYGNEVSEGVLGNIILTRLHPGPMPLIRYFVGDKGINYPSKVCECGRGFPLMGSIQGRSTDVIITPSGNRLIVHFFTGVLEHFQEIDTFQIIQEEPNKISVLIIPTTHISDDVKRTIIQRLKDKGCDDLTINIDLVSQIPISITGKRKFIVSKLSNQ